MPPASYASRFIEFFKENVFNEQNEITDSNKENMIKMVSKDIQSMVNHLSDITGPNPNLVPQDRSYTPVSKTN